MSFKGWEFSTGTTGNFQPELTALPTATDFLDVGGAKRTSPNNFRGSTETRRVPQVRCANLGLGILFSSSFFLELTTEN